MTIAIPVWLMWTLGIVGGALAVAVGVFVIMLAVVGLACARGIGGGLRW